jgi:hypothetical protein
MKKITLIGIMHKEIGKCNMNELLKVLENIKPDVIFEETNRYKNMLTYTFGIEPDSPELKAIQKYIQNNYADCIPVDNLEEPSNFSELEKIFALSIMERNENNKEMYELFNFSNEFMYNNGIEKMNSEYFDNLLIKKHKLCEDYIKKYKMENLDKYNEYVNYIYTQREEIMIETIKNYLKDKEYFNAVFIIGVDHRVTIIDKLKNIENIEYVFYLENN